MPDLEQELRELLTDEHLSLPLRPHAARIVHDGVRHRRRRRAITISTLAATTVGAAVAAVIVVPSALNAGGTHHPTPVQPRPGYDVAWIDKPAPKLWSPKPIQPNPPTMDAPRCLANQLHVGGAVSNGATGMLFMTISLRNISTAPCLLVGRPVRVAAQSPGKPDVIASHRLHMPSSGVGGDLQPGKSGYLMIETDRDCPARYATPNTFPTSDYTSLSVTLPSGTSFSLPVKLDVECGLRAGGLGVRVPAPIYPPDPRDQLQPSIAAPERVTPGQPLTYVVTLTNPTDKSISLEHCPGYVEALGTPEGLGVAKNSLGLNCSTVHELAGGQSVSYQMRLDVPRDATPGVLELRWTLAAALAPEATATVVII